MYGLQLKLLQIIFCNFCLILNILNVLEVFYRVFSIEKSKHFRCYFLYLYNILQHYCTPGKQEMFKGSNRVPVY